MIRPTIPNPHKLPNRGLALFYMLEGLVGTAALLFTAVLFLSGNGRGSELLIGFAIAAAPGYALQWGYIQYQRGKLGPVGRKRLWLSNMIYNLSLIPLVLIPTGMVSSLGSDDEAIMFMAPLILNTLLISGLSVWGWVRERRALQSVS